MGLPYGGGSGGLVSRGTAFAVNWRSMGPRAARTELAWILTAVSFGLERHTLVRSLPTAPQNTGPK